MSLQLPVCLVEMKFARDGRACLLMSVQGKGHSGEGPVVKCRGVHQLLCRALLRDDMALDLDALELCRLVTIAWSRKQACQLVLSMPHSRPSNIVRHLLPSVF